MVAILKKVIPLLCPQMNVLKLNIRKTKEHTGENYIFTTQIHSKEWMQAGMISLFYGQKKSILEQKWSKRMGECFFYRNNKHFTLKSNTLFPLQGK